MNFKLTLRVPAEQDRIANFDINMAAPPNKMWGRFVKSRLPDLLGIHLYPTIVGSMIVADLSINNGVIPFLGKLYYDEILAELDDPNYEIRTIPYPGSVVSDRTWAIAKKLTAGFNVILPKEYIKRRFVICSVNTPLADSNAALQYSYVTIPAKVTNYGPHRINQPTVNRASEQTRCSNLNLGLLNSFTNGTPFYSQYMTNIAFGAIGPSIPNGEIWAGAPAGDGIHPYTGYEQCNASLFMHRMMYNANWDRMPIACYDVNGNIVPLESWPNFNASIPQLTKGEVGREGDIELVEFLTGNYNSYKYKVYNPNYSGQCPYESNKRQFRAYDIAHLRRASWNLEPLLEYTDSEMAKEDASMLFEYCRQFRWGNRSDSKVVPNYPGDYIPETLKANLYYARLNPGKGSGVDRAYAWGMYHAALAYKANPSNITVIPWIIDAVELFNTAADSHGIVQRDYHPPYMPTNVNGIQSFHTALIAFGGIAAARVINDAHSKTVVYNLCDHLYNKLGTKSYTYNVYEQGPPHWLWTYENGVYIDPLDINKGDPYGDPTHVLAAMAESSRWSGSVTPLRWSLKQWTPDVSFAARKTRLNNVNWSQRQQTAGMESLFERLY